MDGILPVYKPAGMTSFDVIAQLRRLIHMKKLAIQAPLTQVLMGCCRSH